jgi:hypothetical protein
MNPELTQKHRESAITPSTFDKPKGFNLGASQREFLAKVGALVAVVGGFLGLNAKPAHAETVLDTLTGTTLLTTTASGIIAGTGQSNYRIPLSIFTTDHNCQITNITTVFALGGSQLPTTLSGIHAYMAPLSTWQSSNPATVASGAQLFQMNIDSYFSFR